MTLLPWPQRLLIAVTLLLLGCFCLPAWLNAAARLLMRDDGPQSADAIVALGGDPLCMREGHAAELYHRGLGRKIVVSDLPFAWGGTTGEAKRRFLVCRDVPAEDVVLLPPAYNTRQEADALQSLMQQQQWHSMIVVTSPFHARRALFTIERRATAFKFYSAPLPTAPPEWQPQRWWARRQDAAITVREFISWGNTLAGGWQ
mgnify:CR=1 FL=1